jgi:predicted Zn-ribbon and HTH transcriptional regulator
MPFRKHLLALLSDQPRSASSLARELGLKRIDIEEDLLHAIRSARATGHRVLVLPARCKACGFEFDETRLAKPSKCPACRAGRIYEAQVLVERAHVSCAIENSSRSRPWSNLRS